MTVLAPLIEPSGMNVLAEMVEYTSLAVGEAFSEVAALSTDRIGFNDWIASCPED
jgi:hypothetical protein